MTTIKNPTPEEINEAAEKYAHEKTFPVRGAQYSWSLLQQMKAEKQSAKQDFLAAISWLQTYQTQQQGAVKSASEILDIVSPNRPWDSGGKTDTMIIRCMHEFHNQFQTPAIGGSEWISVEDILPNEGDWLLVSRLGGVMLMAYKYENGKFWPHGYPHPETLITHWQPLPPPPGQSSQPQQNAISETHDIGKMAREFVKKYPELDGFDSFLSGAISQQQNAISVIEEIRKEFEATQYADVQLSTIDYVLTKLKK